MKRGVKFTDRISYEIHLDDECPENPRTWDNLGFIVTSHRKYEIGDENVSDLKDYLRDLLFGNYDQDIYTDDQLEAAFTNLYVWLPVYMYDHSGITISTSPFGCRWDSGLLGYIYVSKSEVDKQDWAEEWLKGRTKYEAAADILTGEIETLDQYCTGEIYGFVVYVDSDEVDSCHGFFGDPEESGCIEEAISICEYYTRQHEEEAIEAARQFIVSTERNQPVNVY